MSIEARNPHPPKADKSDTIVLDSGQKDKLLFVRNALLSEDKPTTPDALWSTMRPQPPRPYAWNNSSEMRLVRQTRGMIADAMLTANEKKEVKVEAGITPELSERADKKLRNEKIKTAIFTVLSEGASHGAGVASSVIDLQDKLHIPTPLLAAGAVVSYGAVAGALWVNEKANAALLRAKGFSADWSSKKHFEKASDEKSERKGARKGYWRWHGALEAAYAVYAGVVTATSGIREGSSYLDAANVAGAVKLLGQAGITSSIAAYERHKQRKIAAEVEVIPSVSEVTLVPVV